MTGRTVWSALKKVTLTGRFFFGSGTDRYRNGSNVTDTCPEDGRSEANKGHPHVDT